MQIVLTPPGRGVAHWRRQRATLEALVALDDQLARDIGFERTDLRAAAVRAVHEAHVQRSDGTIHTTPRWLGGRWHSAGGSDIPNGAMSC